MILYVYVIQSTYVHKIGSGGGGSSAPTTIAGARHSDQHVSAQLVTCIPTPDALYTLFHVLFYIV